MMTKTKKAKKTKKKQTHESPGFNQYPVSWDGVNFKFVVEEVQFYGWRRITSSVQEGKFWAVDVFAKINKQSFAIRSVPYTEDDPLNNKLSINADLCAIANQWWFERCNGNARFIEDLVKRSEEPVIYFKSLTSVDTAISNLKKYRDEAILCGHTRFIRLEGDGVNGPKVTVQLSLREGAETYRKSRVAPPLQVTTSVEPEESIETTNDIVTEANALLSQLGNMKSKTEGRKLRAALRKLGYHGGFKAIKERLESKAHTPAVSKKPTKQVEHKWRKVSLVTEVGGYDRMRCELCGVEGKRYGLGQNGVTIRGKRSDHCKPKKVKARPTPVKGKRAKRAKTAPRGHKPRPKGSKKRSK